LFFFFLHLVKNYMRPDGLGLILCDVLILS